MTRDHTCESSSGARILVRAAPTPRSLASGSPSSRRQASARAAAFPRAKAKRRSTAGARWRIRATAATSTSSPGIPAAPGSDSANDSTANLCSARRRSGSRLMAGIMSLGAPSSISGTSSAAATACLRLSRTSSRWRSRSAPIGGVGRGACSPDAESLDDGGKDEARVADQSHRNERDAPAGVAAQVSDDAATRRDASPHLILNAHSLL